MEEQLFYLYCLANKMPEIKKSESLIDNPCCLNYKGLAIIGGKVKESEFGDLNLKKNLADLEWIKSKVCRHEKVIEWTMQSSVVIPFKFPTLFKTEENLKACLDEHWAKFEENLKFLEGKEEWGVKIYCDLEKLKQKIEQDKDEFLQIDREIGISAPGKAFLLKKKRERLVNSAVVQQLNEYGQSCFEKLSKYSSQWRINKLLPKEVTEKKEEMILNPVFLIDKSKVTDFVNAVNELRTEDAPKGFLFDCTGPWPPYNFFGISSGENNKSE